MRARLTDPETSHEAAQSVEDKMTEQQGWILEALKARRVATDGELYALLREQGRYLSPSGARTRRKELVDMGLVEDSGMRMFTPSHRRTIVWRRVEKEPEQLSMDGLG